MKLPPGLLSPFFSGARRVLTRTLAIMCFSAAGIAFSAPAPTEKKTIDVPADIADRALKTFSAQTGMEVVFATGVANGVRTNAVKGDYVPLEAAQHLLAGTGLSATQDPTTGAVMVNRTTLPPPAKNAPGRVDPPSVTRAPAASPEAASTAADGESVILNPFIVSTTTESGYSATNTLDGSRLNTALRDTPAAISVFTRDLLDDINATDLSSMLRYDLSSEIDYTDATSGGAGAQIGGLDSTGNVYRTRGLTGSASTNGFRDAGNADDLYNIENVGSTRGPNAILFGTGAAGGVLNLRTKIANVNRNSGSIEGKIGDFDTRRGTFDFNRTLIPKKAALRVMGVYDHKGSFLPYKYNKKIGGTVAGQYRFSDATSLTASFERTRSTGVGSRPWGPIDGVSRFLVALGSGQVVFDNVDQRYETLNGAIVAASSGAGNLGARNVLIYAPDLGTPALVEGPSLNANFVTLSSATSQFTGPVRPIVDESIARFNEVNFTGGAEYGDIVGETFNATLNHRWFKNFYMELAYNLAGRNSDVGATAGPEIRADLNYFLPDGRTENPYFFGKGYYFGNHNMVRITREYRDETLRASFSYEFDLKRFGFHRLAAMTERQINESTRFRRGEFWAGAPFGGTPESANNRVARRRYFPIGGPLAHYTVGYNPEPFTIETYNSAVAPGGALTSTWLPVNNLDSQDEITTDTQLFVMQNYLFDRRLVTTFGLRRDAIDTFGPRTVRDATSQTFRLATADDQSVFDPLGQQWFEESQASGTLRTLGAVLHVTKNFSLTANSSTGIELPLRNRTVLPFDRVPDPSNGDGRDYGLNFTFLDNRIAGSIRYYQSSSLREGNNDLVQETYVDPNNDVMSSFDYYFRQAGVTTFGASDPIRSIDELRGIYFSDAGAYLSDRVSTGYEFETILNPTRNWTLRLGYAQTDRTRTNVLTEGEQWWADRNMLWKDLDTLYLARTGQPSVFNQLLVNEAGVVTTRTVADRIVDSDRELIANRLEEEQGYGNRKHKANLWTRYTFSQSPLKGLAVGGGYRYQSKNIAGYDVPSQTVLYGNERSLFDLLLQYRTKGFFGRMSDRTTFTYQVNIFNLLDDQTIVITKRQIDPVTGAIYNRRAFREDPRSTTFTVRMNF